MTSLTYVTTSWDDGHPNDLRLAAMLARYAITGTFYVPAATERETMSAPQMRELTRDFEIGAHTLHHVDLTGVADHAALSEIVDSKAWIEDMTGFRCLCFCPPIGRYSSRHLGMIRKAGYVAVRSVELLSLDFPRPQAGLLLMPTTVQAFPHRFPVFARNAIKRLALANLWRYVVHGRTAEWPELAGSLLRQAIARGGVFHLWGHSWELEDDSQWQRLEDVLRFMASSLSQAPAVTNGQLCQLTASARPAFDQAMVSAGG
ncbi:hypothetical protein AS156_05060 [Bradyrhizobium macuxiense]|uniref:Chitooligosaccharide deacetylase n=1 Tax=Bradyrhizobium macuxiense TaxID=1755647 RepID=A0A120FNU9_9BRAD|nr:polysaccharide deacetylase family protein [Bradyrhizobium macuxiense]KWV55982.1 hypothetical protein AS156_05060 [Bradyrhizobium macuxiense]